MFLWNWENLHSSNVSRYKNFIKVIFAVICWKTSLAIHSLLNTPWSSYSNHPDSLSSSCWCNSLESAALGPQRGKTNLTKSTSSSLQHSGTFWEEWRKHRAARLSVLQTVWVWERKHCCCHSRGVWEGLACAHSESSSVSHMYVNPEWVPTWTGVLLTFQSAQRVNEVYVASVCICGSLYSCEWVGLIPFSIYTEE